MDTETSPRLIIRRLLGSLVIKLEHQTTWTIGRDEACDIVVQDTWVSRKHSSINISEAKGVYFEDLGSSNGSTINGNSVLSPTYLRDGDVIMVGTTEIEFHDVALKPTLDSEDLALSQDQTEGEIPPSVLITQMHSPQRDIWLTLLTSQGLAVQVDPSYPDLQEYLVNYEASGQPLPNLLIIDIETYPSNAYAFCRWSRSQFPTLKVLLISGKRTEIFPVERQWATYQGAHDLMTGIQESNLMGDALDTVAKVEQVFKALNLRPQPKKSIFTTLQSLHNQYKDGVGASSI